MTPDIGDEPTPPAPEGPWGPGGFEFPVYPDEEQEVHDFIRREIASMTTPACRRMANYICAMEKTREAGGPGKPADVDRELKEGKGRAYDSLSRHKWSWRLVRHEVVVSALVDEGEAKFDGIVISWDFTDYEDPASMILTAHAVSEGWRVLIAVRRATLTPDGEIPDLEKAVRELIEEVAALRTRLTAPVPVLAESPSVGQQVIRHLAGSNLDYLIELTKGWSEGGLIPVESGDTESLSAAGDTIQGLFPGQRPRPGQILSKTVRLTAGSGELHSVALLAGGPRRQRAYLADTRNAAQLQHHKTMSRRQIEQWGSHWSQHDLAGAPANYGFGHFRSKSEERFQRHFTIVAVRDAYNVFRGLHGSSSSTQRS